MSAADSTYTDSLAVRPTNLGALPVPPLAAVAGDQSWNGIGDGRWTLGRKVGHGAASPFTSTLPPHGLHAWPHQVELAYDEAPSFPF